VVNSELLRTYALMGGTLALLAGACGDDSAGIDAGVTADARVNDAAPPADAGRFAAMHSVFFTGPGDNIDGEDEIRVACDDAAGGPSAHTPCDVGAGSFTFEMWIKGDAAMNTNTSGNGPGSERAAYDWIDGNIFIDRDAYGGSCDGRDFGASIINGRVSFGIGVEEGSGPLTIDGNAAVVESPAVWRHVALVYDDGPNQLRIYVDGALDMTSTQTLIDADRSIPEDGCTQGSASSAARQVDLVFGGEKHGFDDISFEGRIGTIRIWESARTDAEIAATWNTPIPCSASGLVARYDLEEGSGMIAGDTCRVSPAATIDLGTRNRTYWSGDGPPVNLQ